jgi:hypothetical protein
MSYARRSLLLISLALFPLSPTAAEDFFKRDFAKSPLEHQQLAPKKREPRQPAAPGETPVPQSDDHGFSSPEESPVPTPAPTVSPFEDERGTRKPLSLGAIVSGTDTSALAEQFLELGRLASERGIVIGKIFIVGRPSAVLETMDKLQQLDPSMRSVFEVYHDVTPVYSVPPRYSQVTQTPTWLVEMPEGEIVVEGTGLHRLFDSSGRFREPKKLE